MEEVYMPIWEYVNQLAAATDGRGRSAGAVRRSLRGTARPLGGASGAAFDVHDLGHAAAAEARHLVVPVRLEHHPAIGAGDDQVLAVRVVGVRPGADARIALAYRRLAVAPLDPHDRAPRPHEGVDAGQPAPGGHDAEAADAADAPDRARAGVVGEPELATRAPLDLGPGQAHLEAAEAVPGDRKSTRLNSSHSQISYAVFCLKKKSKHSGPAAIDSD